MTGTTTKEIGDAHESRAVDYLVAHGLALEARNYRTRMGEIDIVMRDGDTFVFVEVRRRRHRGYGGAIGSIGPAKQRRIARTALAYLQRRYRRCDLPMRFDVVAIDGERGELTWHRSAFAF